MASFRFAKGVLFSALLASSLISTAEAQGLGSRTHGELEWLDEPIPVPDPRLP